jgi:hypothetical protein
VKRSDLSFRLLKVNKMKEQQGKEEEETEKQTRQKLEKRKRLKDSVPSSRGATRESRGWTGH